MADNWLTEGWGDALFGDEPYEELSLDQLLDLDYGKDAGLGSLIDDTFGTKGGSGLNLDFLDDPNYLSSSLDDTFTETLLNFDFDDPKADWGAAVSSFDTDPATGIAWNTGLFEDILGDMSGQGYTPEQNLIFGEAFGTPGAATSGGGGTPKAIKAIEDIIKAFVGGGKDGGGILGLGENMLDNDLVKILLGNYLLKKDKEGSGGYVPIGQEAYGGAGQNIPDYRVTNLLPALMPGVAYANVAQPGTPPPMRQGGIAGLASPEGPGDITLAKLEPGEFVVSRPATQRIGAQNLYRMMKQAEGMS